MKNITFSIDERLLEAARKYAALENTTIDAKFRQWLEDYTERQRTDKAIATISALQDKICTDGRKFTRDEMNER